MNVSIIIPTVNEADHIGPLVCHLYENSDERLEEILVVDGGSTDTTIELACAAGATVLKLPTKGRASQMNHGAAAAKGGILYFVHSDTLPPATYLDDIQQALQEDYPIGCFRFRFNSNSLLLKINSYFTRFDRLWCRGGDQTLFVKKTLFEQLNGYRNDYLIMEEYDFIIRARKAHSFKIIPRDVLVSARKYEDNTYLRVQLANLIIFNMFRLGYAQDRMVRTYKWLLDYRNEV